jgi:hypothetical protein
MALFRPNLSGSGGSGGGGTTNTGSLLITASYVYPDLVFTKGDGSTFNVNISASATLQADLLSNVTVGGSDAGTLYPSGTLLESILRDILIDQIGAQLTFNSLINEVKSVGTIVVPPTTQEVSSSITFNTASFGASANSPGGLWPLSASFTASGASTGNFNIYLTDGPLGSSNIFGLGIPRTVNLDTDDSITFTINATEPTSLAPISATLTLTYLYPIYHGMVTGDYSTGNLEGHLTKLLEGKGTKTLLMNGTNAFIYFAYPASYGNLTSIKDSNQFEYLNAPGTFTKYTTTQSGSIGWSTSYYVYKYTANLPNGTTTNQNFTFTF